MWSYLKRHWNLPAGLGVWGLVAVAGLLREPPPVTPSMLNPGLFTPLALATLGAALFVLAACLWARPGHVWYWAGFAALFGALGTVALLDYWRNFNAWTCRYEGFVLVVGDADNLTVQGAKRARELGTNDPAQLLADFPARPADPLPCRPYDIWTQEAIDRRASILQALHLAIPPLVAAALACVVQVLWCWSRKPSRPEPDQQPPAPEQAELLPPEPATPPAGLPATLLDPVDYVEVLQQLLPAHFDLVVFHMKIGPDVLDGAQAQKALQLVQWAQAEHRLDGLHQALHRYAAGALAARTQAPP